MSLVLTSASHICTSSKNTDQFEKAINYLDKHPKTLSLHLTEKRNWVFIYRGSIQLLSFFFLVHTWSDDKKEKSVKTSDLPRRLIPPGGHLFTPTALHQTLLLWTPPKPGLCTISSLRHRLYYFCPLKQSLGLKITVKLLLQLLAPFKTFVL